MKKNVRKQGILLPISSIPSTYGIGTFGKESYRFVDFLEKSGNHLWQILPLGPTGYGDSPYQSFSTFAGNPYYIDLELLIEDGYLTKEICDSYDFGDNEHYVDYEKIYLSRFKVLKIAFDNAREQGLTETGDYQKFLTENAYWLDDYALYMAVKNAFGGVCFMEWDEDIRLRKAAALRKYRKKLAEEIAFYCFQQYLFAKQWKELKAYANKKGIEIVGDIPIYVAFDSADTWANPKLFQLDKEGRPIGVAGCPPDCFSETGQLWGNPLYDWDAMAQNGYAWWVRRIRHMCSIYDVVRIDHFRGFAGYYAIPYGNKTAEGGRWRTGPGYALFAAIKKKLGEPRIIAEDLGFLTDDVRALLKECAYPGMKVLEFAFDSRDGGDYRPHSYPTNCIAYTGTHDNEPVDGWFGTALPDDIERAIQYLNLTKEEGMNWGMMRGVWSSVADLAVVQAQDVLGLGHEARMNTPATLGGNWCWRALPGAFTPELAQKLHDAMELYGRLPEEPAAEPDETEKSEDAEKAAEPKT